MKNAGLNVILREIFFMKKEVVITLAALSVLLFAQCAKKLNPTTNEKPKPAPVVATVKEGSPEQLTMGKSIFTDNCGKCHELHQPSEFSIKRWEVIMPQMSKKAELNKEQTAAVTAWVMANAKK